MPGGPPVRGGIMDATCDHELAVEPDGTASCPLCGCYGRMVDGVPTWEWVVRTHRYSFRGGYYATANAITDAGARPRVCTGVFFGKGGKDKAVAAALHEARTGTPHPHDRGCPG